MENNDTSENAPVVNVAVYLQHMAKAYPFRRAVVCPAGRDRRDRPLSTQLTFRQLDRESDCLAHGLAGIGITRGTRTILMVMPSLEFFVLTFALFKVGAVPVVVDPGMGIDRMLDCLKESQAQALIGIPRAHLLRTLRPGYFKSVKTWVTVGRRLFWGGATLDGIRQTPWQPFDTARTRADETAAILFTTGSTGPAKGAVYTHGIFDAQLRHIRRHFDIAPGEIDLPTFPLFALFDPALGMTAVIPDMDPTQPARVNPDRIIEAILANGVTNMFASPALLNRVGRYGRARGVRLPSLKRVVSAGAPVSPANIEQFAAMLDAAAQVHTPYGATEAVPIISIASDEIMAETRALSEKGYGMCVGRPLTGITVRIIGISDAPIDRWHDDLAIENGEIGEITVKGDLVTRQYFQRPEADALHKIADDNGFWHRMGDLGWIDNKGRIWFCGRKSHRVTTARETLFSVPCEAVFNAHPDVYRSALVGIGRAPAQTAVICIETEKNAAAKDRSQLEKELLALAKDSRLTRNIEIILFHEAFPVDIRHNSKIFREKLALWAQQQLG